LHLPSVLALAGALAGACARQDHVAPAAPDGQETTASAGFWTAFLAQRYDQLPVVLSALEAAAAANPDDAAAAELDALAIVWKISEAARDPSQDPSQIPGLAVTAEHSLLRANQLQPTDPVILGRLGSLEIAIGNVLHDPTRIASGKAEVDQGVQQYPEFMLFNRARLLFDLAPGDPDAADRLDDFWKKLDACAGAPVDRAAFDIGKYLAEVTAEGPRRVCWNTAHTPHGLEGFFVYMGDALVKRGDAATARVIYGNARKSPGYAGWPFQALLDDRLASADAWAARWTDADPSNDPVLINAAPVACAVCHAAR